MAVWALLAATARRRASADARLQPWLEANLAEAIGAAASGAPSELALWSPDEIEKWSSLYVGQIGAVRQTLPGGKEELDPLLHPEPDPGSS